MSDIAAGKPILSSAKACRQAGEARLRFAPFDAGFSLLTIKSAKLRNSIYD
jgi:hypothetical protein